MDEMYHFAEDLRRRADEAVARANKFVGGSPARVMEQAVSLALLEAAAAAMIIAGRPSPTEEEKGK